MKLPTFSIVTPSYNQAAFLQQTIESVLSQEYPRLDYIIMDAGSTDGSVEIIRRYAERLAYWQSAKDGGPAAALNAGFRRATGEILAYINSDDCYLPGALSTAAEVFGRHPGVDVIYGDIDIIDAQNQPTTMPGRHVHRFKAIPLNLRYMACGCLVIPQQASFWRRRVFERVGGFVESNVTSWDGEFFADAAIAAMRFHHEPRVLAQFRIHSTSITGSCTLQTGKLKARYHEDLLRVQGKWAAAGICPSRVERVFSRLASGFKRAVRYASR